MTFPKEMWKALCYLEVTKTLAYGFVTLPFAVRIPDLTKVCTRSSRVIRCKAFSVIFQARRTSNDFAVNDSLIEAKK